MEKDMRASAVDVFYTPAKPKVSSNIIYLGESESVNDYECVLEKCRWRGKALRDEPPPGETRKPPIEGKPFGMNRS